ncbi:MAG TPA: hypothetical protein VMM38_07230 [Aridibacter sp.]|nr:hypothetical protein [Aridibacter sp.]
MDEKQNQTGISVSLTCANCGGIRFLLREDLSEDQLLVAERIELIRTLSGEAGLVFCARCLYPARAPESKV